MYVIIIQIELQALCFGDVYLVDHRLTAAYQSHQYNTMTALSLHGIQSGHIWTTECIVVLLSNDFVS